MGRYEGGGKHPADLDEAVPPRERLDRGRAAGVQPGSLLGPLDHDRLPGPCPSGLGRQTCRRSGRLLQGIRPGVGWDLVDTQITTLTTSSQIQPYVDADAMSNVYTVWTGSRNGSSNPDIFYDTRLRQTWAGNSPLVYSATGTTNSVQQYTGYRHQE